LTKISPFFHSAKKHFDSSEKLCSWAWLSPRNDEISGKYVCKINFRPVSVGSIKSEKKQFFYMVLESSMETRQKKLLLH